MAQAKVMLHVRVKPEVKERFHRMFHSIVAEDKRVRTGDDFLTWLMDRAEVDEHHLGTAV